jgi:chromosome segregation ATPase
MDELQIMSEGEKAAYLEQLRVEVLEYRTREKTYEAKRKELLEIETAFRTVQRRAKNDNRNNDVSGDTQDLLVDNIKGQILEFQRKRKMFEPAFQELTDKLREIEEQCRKRDDEHRELLGVVAEKQKRAEHIQTDVAEMRRDQEAMLNDFEAEKRQLFANKDDKVDAEGTSSSLAAERAELLDELQHLGLDGQRMNRELAARTHTLRDLEQ